MEAAKAELIFDRELLQMIPDALMLLSTIAEECGFNVAVHEQNHTIEVVVGYGDKKIYTTYSK